MPRPGDPRDEYKEPRPPHGLSLVVVQLVGTATWCATWRDVLAMYSGVKHLKFPPIDARWREVAMVERQHSRPVLGLESVFREMLGELNFQEVTT